MQHQVDDVHLRINLLLHVIVLILQLSNDSTFTIGLVHLFCTFQNEALTIFKAFAIVIADDITQFGQFYVTLDTQQMIESLITLCGLWTFVGRQQLCKLRRQHIGARL